MTIFSYTDALPEIGRARAAHTGRAWFLVEEVASARVRLTDDPNPGSKEAILAVFPPVEPDPTAAA